MLALKAAKNLKFSGGDITKDERDGDLSNADARAVRISEDRHKGFFAYRRAEVLALANSNLLSEPGFTTLINRVKADFEEVSAFVSSIVQQKHLDQTAPDGATPSAPDGAFRAAPGKHLDLTDVARATLSGEVNAYVTDAYLEMRVSNVKSIVWRATGLHGELWNEAASSNRLRAIPLTEILDRRLRLVERAAFQVNAALDQTLTLGAGGGPRGPWVDDARVRMFEYPFVTDGVEIPVDIRSLIGSPAESFWDVHTNRDGHTTQITYAKNIGTATNAVIASTRFAGEPDTTSPVWNPPLSFTYYRTFTPSGGQTLSQALDSLMTPSLDWWGRTWIYCDHVADVLHLDALRFALLRGTQSDALFNAIPSSKSVVLLPPLARIPDDLSNPTVPPANTLFIDGPQATWFDNNYVRPEKFQVGDQLVFWNHVLYLAFFRGAWRLENAMISRVESDPLIGGIRPFDLAFEGHGMTSIADTHTQIQRRPGIASYTKDMSGEMAKGLANVRDDAKETFEPGGFQLFETGGAIRYAVVRWKPYDDLDTSLLGPWFIFIPRARNGNPLWSSVDSMLRNIHHSVTGDPNPGPGYRAPNDGNSVITIPSAQGPETFQVDDGVFFPLYLPQAADSDPIEWRQYFVQRRRDPTLRFSLVEYALRQPDINQLLRAHAADPDLNPSVDDLTGDVPGLFLGGEQTLPVQVLRPKVRV